MLTERMHFYRFPAPVVPGVLSEGLNLQTDSDAPFLLTSVVVWNLAVNQLDGFDGQLALRFKRPDGRLTQRALTASNLLFPGNQYNFGLTPNVALRCPIRPGILYPQQSVITFDLLGLPSSVVNATGAIIVFCGTKIYNSDAIWAPTYPAKFTAIPYLDNLTVSGITPANFPLVNNIFTAQNDADFVWQAGSYVDVALTGGGCGGGGETDLCQFADLGVIVRDYTYNPYMNDYIPASILFPFLSAQTPGWLYPEIYIPRREQMLFDLNYLYPGFTTKASPVSVTLGLKGMKVYAQ